MTIAEYYDDGDALVLKGIREEYNYYLGEVFDLYELRDSYMLTQRSTATVTVLITTMQSRMRYLDERYHTISCLPVSPDYGADANPRRTSKARVWGRQHFDVKTVPLSLLPADRAIERRHGIKNKRP